MYTNTLEKEDGRRNDEKDHFKWFNAGFSTVGITKGWTPVVLDIAPDQRGLLAQMKPAKFQQIWQNYERSLSYTTHHR